MKMNVWKSGILAAVMMTGLALFAQEKNAVKIACVGDSITAGACSSRGNDYPSALQRLLGKDFQVVNFGVSGRTGLKKGMENDGSPRGYQLMGQYQKSLDFQPDVVLLMFGTNDSKPVNWKKLSGEFAADMESRILEYRNLKSKPVVILGLPAYVKHGSFQIDGKIVENEVIPILKDLAKKLNCPTVDIFTLTKAHADQAFSRDGVHPCDAGYLLLAQEFQKAIQRLKLKK